MYSRLGPGSMVGGEEVVARGEVALLDRIVSGDEKSDVEPEGGHLGDMCTSSAAEEPGTTSLPLFKKPRLHEGGRAVILIVVQLLVAM